MIHAAYLLAAAALGFFAGHAVGYARGFNLNKAIDRLVGGDDASR